MNIRARVQKLEQAKPSNPVTYLGQATADFLWDDFGIKVDPMTPQRSGPLSPETRKLLDDFFAACAWQKHER